MIITITMIIKKNEDLVRPLGYDITAKYSSSPTSIKAEYIRLLCPNILSSQVTIKWARVQIIAWENQLLSTKFHKAKNIHTWQTAVIRATVSRATTLPKFMEQFILHRYQNKAVNNSKCQKKRNCW